MSEQIKNLTVLSLLNYFNLNEIRYGKDKKKKRRYLSLLVAWSMVGVMLMFYTAALAYGYGMLGIETIIPAYIVMVTSLVIFFFSVFKAGSIIFQMQTYEMLISLPVSPTAIIVSRFLTMYVGNLVLSVLTVVPASVVYGFFVKPSAVFYLMTVVGTLILPLFPMTLATIIGAVVITISSRMKHKNLATIIISLGLTMLVLVLCTKLSFEAENLSDSILINLSQVILEQTGRIYPFALLYRDAVVNGNWISLLLFAGGSILIFCVFVYIIQRRFVAICSALQSRRAGKNYKMQELKTQSPLMALYQKEIKRYFSSNIYVINTLIGYLMMVAASVVLCMVGVDQLESLMQISGIIRPILPFAVSSMAILLPITASSISLEGKQWWFVKSIPVPVKTIFDSKIMVQLTIAAPCYLISEIFLLITMQGDVWMSIWTILLPAAYILFSAVLGIKMNSLLPIFNWENEVVVVKQGAAGMVSMLLGFILIALPIVAIILLKSISFHVIMGVTLLLLLLATVLLYQSNNKINLNTIE